MAARLELLGFVDYRRSDALVFRVLDRGPLPVGALGAALGTSRQAARKVVAGLEERGLAVTQRDRGDRRRTNVLLTPAGVRYAAAVVQVVEELNAALVGRVPPADLATTRAVLRLVIDDGADPAPGERRPGEPPSN
jgi:DNA-binding MarR family transcriptional regulator